jgi:4-amino-4-deoxy-L-arabinose transferase-like glycosyltransferase
VHLLLLVALNFPFLYWSFSGMETNFYSFFLVSAAFYFSRHLTEAPPRMGTLALSGLLFVLALMIRPETYVLFPLTLVFIVLRNRRRSILPIIVFLSSAILIYAPYFVWRLSYYGHLFPNTYYAKVVAPGSYHVTMLGLRYLRIGMVPYLLFIILILIKMARNKGRLRVEEYYLLSLISVQLIGVLAVGADHFSELRYFVYMLPFLYLLSFDEIGNVIDLMAEYIFSSWKSLGLFKGQLLCLICILCFLQSFYYNNAGPKAISEKGDRSLADNWIVLGQWLNANSNADDLIATPVIGAIGYYCDRTIIDMLGLVDPVIAHTDVIPGQGPRDHERYNSEYVMSRKPAYIYVFSPYRTELQFLKNWHWAPAIRDLKKYFPNRDYKYTVVKVLDKEFTLYKRDDQ